MHTRLTIHGKDRGKQRAGLDKRALSRTAATALEQGLHARDTKGQLRRYLDKLCITHEGKNPLVHGNHVFCFGRANVLVTVLELPHHLRRSAASAAAKKSKRQP